VKTAGLPQSNNIEDRRSEGRTDNRPRKTLMEQLQEPLSPSPLSEMAGIKDISHD
jgi:hypothetical protein